MDSPFALDLRPSALLLTTRPFAAARRQSCDNCRCLHRSVGTDQMTDLLARAAYAAVRCCAAPHLPSPTRRRRRRKPSRLPAASAKRIFRTPAPPRPSRTSCAGCCSCTASSSMQPVSPFVPRKQKTPASSWRTGAKRSATTCRSGASRTSRPRAPSCSASARRARRAWPRQRRNVSAGYLASVEALYGDGTKVERDASFNRALGDLASEVS